MPKSIINYVRTNRLYFGNTVTFGEKLACRQEKWIYGKQVDWKLSYLLLCFPGWKNCESTIVWSISRVHLEYVFKTFQCTR